VVQTIFEAYFNCRGNKRTTANAIAFEVDYESNLIALCEEIYNGTYQIGRSIAFIVNKPVKREIFEAVVGVFSPTTYFYATLPIEKHQLN